jgi:hypothetical protein
MTVFNTYVHHPHTNEEVLSSEHVVIVAVKLAKEVDHSGMIGPQPLKYSAQKTQQQLFSFSGMFEWFYM